ncbi:MAG TPA: EamA family transporter [Patescibacteria group bacterium]|nr:EamA family transporter [Patescibacteria group bacterium]
MKNVLRNPVFALVIANVIWGAAPSIFKLALQEIPPFTLAFIRFFIAGLLFLPFVIPRWSRLTVLEWSYIGASAFFGIALHIGFFFIGLQDTPSINAPLILSSAPVFLFLGSVFFLREKIKLKVLCGMMLSGVGVLLIVFYPLLLTGKIAMNLAVKGNFFLVISTISGMVIKPLLNKSIMKRMSVVQLTFLEFILGSFMFLPFALRESATWSVSQLQRDGWIGIVFGIFFSSALAYFLFNWGISKVKAQEVGIFYYIDPLTGLVLGMLLLSEFPNIYYGLGAIFIFIGIFIAENRFHYHPIHKIQRN